MKIVHINLGSFYIDNYKYQENLLPKIHKDLGYEVEIIASTLIFKDNMKLTHTIPSVYYNEHNIKVTRIAYKKIVNKFITDKVRQGIGLLELLYESNPDYIFVHGFQTKSLDDIATYKKKNGKVNIFVDTHSDFYTSGTNWLSKNILHGLYYRKIIKRNLKYIDKVYYISVNCGKFARDVYKLNSEKLEFLPLGSILHKDVNILRNKKNLRLRHKLTDKNIVFLQAGKIDKAKMLLESLNEFVKTTNPNFRYFIVGSITPDIEKELKTYIGKDSRIVSVGWKKSDELTKYIDFCDVFIQPGKVSAILQDAISAFKPVIVKYYEDYVPFVKSNGWLFNEFMELSEIYDNIDKNQNILVEMSLESKEIAKEMLDYYKIGFRIFSDVS